MKKKKKTKRKRKLKIKEIPLAKTISLGPDASSGCINYHYLHYSNIFDFFEIQMEKNEYLNELVCIPDIGYNSEKAFLKIDIMNKSKVNISPVDKEDTIDSFIKEIKKCMKHRFVPINLAIIVPTIDSHANIILMDTKNKTVELFEPHGDRDEISSLENIKGAYDKVSKNIKKFFKKYFSTYKFISPGDYELKYGLQERIDAYDGLCVSWGALYLHYRLLNPDINQKKLIKYIDTTMTKKKILRYIRYIEDTIKYKI